MLIPKIVSKLDLGLVLQQFSVFSILVFSGAADRPDRRTPSLDIAGGLEANEIKDMI